MKLGVCLFSALSVAALLAVSVSFPTVPKDTTAKIAGSCIEKGLQVSGLSENQVRCEIAMTNEHKAHMLFTRFHQRRFTNQVRQWVDFTVVPTDQGSIVQAREVVEAVIGNTTRQVEVRGDNEGRTANFLVSVGGTVR